MTASRALRIVLVAYWVLLVASVVLSFTLQAHLPEPLREYLQQQEERDIEMPRLAVLLLGLPVVLGGSLLSSFGLFFYRRWARWLFLYVFVLGYLMYPAIGPTVEHAVPQVVHEIATLLGGVVLGIAFFADVPWRQSTDEGDLVSVRNR